MTSTFTALPSLKVKRSRVPFFGLEALFSRLMRFLIPPFWILCSRGTRRLDRGRKIGESVMGEMLLVVLGSESIIDTFLKYEKLSNFDESSALPIGLVDC